VSAATSLHRVRSVIRNCRSERTPREISASERPGRPPMRKDRLNRSDRDSRYPALASTRPGFFSGFRRNFIQPLPTDRCSLHVLLRLPVVRAGCSEARSVNELVLSGSVRIRKTRGSGLVKCTDCSGGFVNLIGQHTERSQREDAVPAC
jgi:hypothetical protein